MAGAYRPTIEQTAIIRHDGHAFVRACPGAGKTRTMVERARHVLGDPADRRGLGFLSFTNAAVDELAARLADFGALSTPLFPSFIGTFDRFLWQFLITPFGVEGCDRAPRLVPDKKDWAVKPPYDRAQVLTLECFDRLTGSLIQEKAAKFRFAPKNGPVAWESIARRKIAHALAEGHLDFIDVRICVHQRLADKNFAALLGAALAARFQEIIVDEAQDCNPADIGIISWLRASGVTVKIICDPNQGIYRFRGGLTDELEIFADTFDQAEHLPMSGNFRSSPAICAAISQLRPPSSRGTPDEPLGPEKADSTPVHLLSYGGTAVPATIGATFQALAQRLGIKPKDAPLLASTWMSASNAAGRRMIDPKTDKTLVFAQSVMGFLSAFEAGNRHKALGRLHRAVLLIRGHIGHVGDYSTYLAQPEQEGGGWREEIIAIGQALRPLAAETGDQWLSRARALLDRDLRGALSIRQRLRNNVELEPLLATDQATDLPARAIHAVKGLEFPAVCVVLVPRTAGSILEVLRGASMVPEHVEDARKIYVGASRAERLLAIATPRSRVADLKAILEDGTATVTVLQI